MFKKIFIILALNFLFSACATAQELPTVPHVDLKKYLGQWYEVAAIPQFFQKQCVRDTKAVYSMAEKNRIKVENSCVTKDGTIDLAEGQAKVIDETTNSKLKVTFAKIFGWAYIFGGKYWIVDLAPDYRYALVGHPKRSYAWVLSRTQKISPSDLSYIESKYKSLGYDTCQILTSVQTNGFSSRQPLCQVVQKN